MTVYWLLFGFFAAGALFSALGQHQVGQSGAAAAYPRSMAFAGLLIVLLVGLRYQVGGDWDNYVLMLKFAASRSLPDVLAAGDVGYQFLNWLSGAFGVEVWLVNLLSAAFFTYGLVKLARIQPQPWLVLLVAVPYLIIVVAMGYTRQAVALGFLMAGLAARIEGASLLRLAAYVAIAAMFHRTAVVAFPLIALAAEHSRLRNLLIGVALTWLFYDFFLAAETRRFVAGYLEARYMSQGAAIRVAMCAVPAGLFFLLNRRLGFAETERLIWRNFSLAALAMVVLLFVIPASAAVDRVALYLLPLQLAILPRAAGVMASRALGAIVIVLYSFAIQFTWLNYAAHAGWWVPYRFYPL